MDQSEVNGEPSYLNLKSQLVPIPIGSSFYDLDSCKRTKTITGKYYFIKPRVISTQHACLAMFLLINGLKLKDVEGSEETKKQVLRQLSRRVKHKVEKTKPNLWREYRKFEDILEPFNFKHMELYGQVDHIINGNTLKVIFDLPFKSLSRWHMHHDKDGTVNKRFVCIPYGDRNAGLIIEHNVKIWGIKGETRETKKGKAQMKVLESLINENNSRIFVHLLGYIPGGFVRGHIYFDATKTKTLAEELLGMQHPKFKTLFESAFTAGKNGMEYQSVKQVKGRFRVKQQKKKYDYGTEHGNHIKPVQSIEYDDEATKTVKRRDQKAVKAVNKVNKKNQKKRNKNPDGTMIGLPDGVFEDPDRTMHRSNFISDQPEPEPEVEASEEGDDQDEGESKPKSRFLAKIPFYPSKPKSGKSKTADVDSGNTEGGDEGESEATDEEEGDEGDEGDEGEDDEGEAEEDSSDGPLGLPDIKSSGDTLNAEELQILAKAAAADEEMKKKPKKKRKWGWGRKRNSSDDSKSQEENSETSEPTETAEEVEAT